MKIFIGLGNPGLKYENTRHNAGYMVMDQLAQKLGMSYDQEKFSSYFAKAKIKGEDVVLLKPTTYMNNSGIALRQCLDFYKANMSDVIVIYDDVDLNIGRLRLRQKGSAGGHNGIKSIMQNGFSDQFDRIRVGVGKDPQVPMISWVLSKFKEEEKKPLQEAIERAAEACVFSIQHTFTETMNMYNKK